MGLAGRRAGSRVPGRLPDRALAVARQHLRLRGAVQLLRGARRAGAGQGAPWGIALALVLRLVFILGGAALLDAFHITFYVFGALLLYTAWKLARHEEPRSIPSTTRLLAAAQARPMTEGVPREGFHGANGKRVATPLVAVFVVVATTDVMFAVDSIPAIFAITQDPFIVFAANAFAMLGLRALYFLLVGLMDRFVYLYQGLAVILAFIGVKMLLIDVWHVPIWLSLAIIVGMLVIDRGPLAAGRSRSRRKRSDRGHPDRTLVQVAGDRDRSAGELAPRGVGGGDGVQAVRALRAVETDDDSGEHAMPPRVAGVRGGFAGSAGQRAVDAHRPGLDRLDRSSRRAT